MASLTNILPEHVKAFEALSSGQCENFALVSCFVNGEPTCAIAAIVRPGLDDFRIHPLFVAVTDSMKLTDHEGQEAKL